MHEARGNNLLRSLRPEDRAPLLALARPVDLDSGARLYEPGDSIEQCYFPTGAAIASFYVLLEDGQVLETAMIGREGALGGIVSHGRLPAFARSQVLHGGVFLKIPLAELEALKEQHASIGRLFNRYADCFVAQIFQAVACNAAHGIDQRTAKWLIAAHERTGDARLLLTQESLAGLLGTGRAYVSRVLHGFRDDGLVRLRRGSIELLSPAGLAARACQCNDLVTAHFEEVLGGVYPAG